MEKKERFDWGIVPIVALFAAPVLLACIATVFFLGFNGEEIIANMSSEELFGAIQMAFAVIVALGVGICVFSSAMQDDETPAVQENEVPKSEFYDLKRNRPGECSGKEA